MKQFYSFQSALDYHRNCPFCFARVQINDRDLATDYNYGVEKISLYLDQREDDVVSIDLMTEELQFSLSKRMPDIIYTAGSSGSFYKSEPCYNGILIHGLTLDCKSCCKFSYTIQIKLDLTERRLTGTYLNSECISLEDNDIVHEIRNNYPSEQTHYSYFLKDGSDKRVTMPLIPLDFNNLKDTVARIRKLIIFS